MSRARHVPAVVLLGAALLLLPACGGYVQREAKSGKARAGAPMAAQAEAPNTEAYDCIVENEFQSPSREPLSTFAIDVDTASYSNVRRFLSQGVLPTKDAVRIEEMVNYFPYAYPPPQGATPFAVHTEIADCPWNIEHRLVRIGLKGREIDLRHRPACNLVFLIDVSGSMQPDNRLPLIQRALRLLVDQLGENDRVAVVVYASDCGVRLPPTSGANKQAILSAIDGLEAGGSTNAGSGIQLAYQQAAASLIPGGSNRIILCTDGDFNVGITDRGELVRMIESKAKAGVALTILGVGFGNLKDATLEQLADRGHGNYAYLDTLAEARKVLVEQMAGTLITIAKDVKVQVEFNPARVTAYRLIGYENRLLRAEDFKDDKKTGGDIGSGHTVTALYEVVPVGKKINLPHVDPLKYQQPARPSDAAKGGELLTVKLRYKDPSGHVSKPVELPVTDAGGALASASGDFRFAAAVAEFGLLLRDSEYRADASFANVLELARAGRGQDPQGYRGEFMKLVQKAQELRGQ